MSGDEVEGGMHSKRSASTARRPMPFPRETAPAPGSSRGLSRLATLLVIMAIGLAAAAGIAFVVGPDWGDHRGASADKGVVPTYDGTPVSFIAPLSIRIPALKATAPIVRVGTRDRELDIPLNPKVVGWWDGGAKPGARRGTAILAGHINYAGVNGVFADIGTLKPGEKLFITGRHLHKRVRLAFAITGVRTYKKTALPYRQIFDQRSVGRIALVTCGGPFDSGTGNYEDNVVVFAVPAGQSIAR